jgi:glycosyltransferase 2 family protein
MLPAQSEAQPRKWRQGLSVLQAIVSVGLIVWLLQRVSWQSLLHTLSGASLGFMVLACCTYYAGVVVNCYKWRLTLAIESMSVSLPRLVGWYLIGSLASNVLPTSIGGDVVRGYYAIRNVGNAIPTSRSILVERLCGLLITVLLAWIGLILAVNQLAWALAILVASLISVVCGGVAIKYAERLPWRLPLLFRKLSSIIVVYLDKPRSVAAIVILSFLFQLLAGLGVWCNFRAVQLDIPFLDILLISSIISVIGLVPISINGWGVSESLFLILLVPFHLPENGILGALLVGRALLFLVSLAGVLPLLLELRRPQPPQAVDREFLG